MEVVDVTPPSRRILEAGPDSARQANNAVLLAEDDGSLRSILAYVLETEGFSVLTATDGEQALAVARREQPLVAILDVLMPGIRGDDVCRTLRDDPQLASTFIVLISALPVREAEAIARDVDADLFLSKPVDHELMVEIISSVFEHRVGGLRARVP
jgi:DNA-binding response OmpR family regulator